MMHPHYLWFFVFRLLAEGPRLSTVSQQQQQQHSTPTPSTATAMVAPPTQQHLPPLAHYPTPHPLPPQHQQQQQLQQQLASQPRFSIISNPPPYFPPSGPPSSGGTMSTLSLAESLPSLPMSAPSMPGYQQPNNPTTEQYPHTLQNNLPTRYWVFKKSKFKAFLHSFCSMSVQTLQQQEQLPYTQPQVYGGGGGGGVPQSGSLGSLPSEYRHNNSLYQPLHQPLL